MYDFTQNKANKKSIASRRSIHIVGVNDADYVTSAMVNGKKIRCPFFIRWCGMIARCYSSKRQEEDPSYIGCSVCQEWHSFMKFRAWMVKQDWDGLELDKDIKIKGNKVYSPDTCLFVTHDLNILFRKKIGLRFPTGVSFNRDYGLYDAKFRFNGVTHHAGSFESEELAGKAYVKVRNRKIQQLIDENTYPVVTKYLAQHF